MKTLRPKPVHGIPFVIASGATGEKLIERLVVIVPDGQTTAPKGLIPGLDPEPILIERHKWACLVRAWRNHPDTPRDRRNFPTIGEVLGLLARRAILEQFTPALP